MLFSTEAFNQLCPSYQQHVLELESELSRLENAPELFKATPPPKDEGDTYMKAQKDLIMAFSKFFLTTGEIWNEWFK